MMAAYTRPKTGRDYTVMAYVVMAYKVMAGEERPVAVVGPHDVKGRLDAYTVMAYTGTAYTGTAYIVMAIQVWPTDKPVHTPTHKSGAIPTHGGCRPCQRLAVTRRAQ